MSGTYKHMCVHAWDIHGEASLYAYWRGTWISWRDSGTCSNGVPSPSFIVKLHKSQGGEWHKDQATGDHDLVFILSF